MNEHADLARRSFVAGWLAGRSEQVMQQLIRHYVDAAPCPPDCRVCESGGELNPSATWN